MGKEVSIGYYWHMLGAPNLLCVCVCMHVHPCTHMSVCGCVYVMEGLGQDYYRRLS